MPSVDLEDLIKSLLSVVAIETVKDYKFGLNLVRDLELGEFHIQFTFSNGLVKRVYLGSEEPSWMDNQWLLRYKDFNVDSKEVFSLILNVIIEYLYVEVF